MLLLNPNDPFNTSGSVSESEPQRVVVTDIDSRLA
jgi:hypothetical protein